MILLNPELIKLAVKVLHIMIQALKKAAVSIAWDFLKNFIKFIVKFIAMKAKKTVLNMFKILEKFTRVLQVPELV